MQDPEALMRMIQGEGRWIAAGVSVLCVLYFLVMRLTSRPSSLVADAAQEAGSE
jgi:hypothetical protein